MIHSAKINNIIQQINKHIPVKIRQMKSKQSAKINKLIRGTVDKAFECTHKLYPHIINSIDIALSKAVTELTSKGSDYNFPPSFNNSNYLIK